MVRSAHLTLSPKHCNAEFDFAVSNSYSYEIIHTAYRWVRRDGLISALVTTLSPRLKTCAEMSPSRHPNNA